MRHTASAYLTFVALNDEGKAIELPPISFESDAEIRRNRLADERRKRRMTEKEMEKEV